MAYTAKWVTSSGGGAHDGTSEANAWSLEEYASALAGASAGAGIVANILSDATHTLTANLTLPSGSAESPHLVRGYDVTAGDLESVGRSWSTGPLDVSNFPLIDATASYQVQMGSYNGLVNLDITGANNNATVLGGTAWNLRRCRVSNTHATGASARAFSGGTNYGDGVDCDFRHATSNSAYIVSPGRGGLYACRVWNTGTPSTSAIAIDVSEVGSSAMRCILFNVGRAFNCGGQTHSIIGNTIYSCSVGVYNPSSGMAIAENIIYSSLSHGIGGTSGGNPLIWNNAMGALTSGRIDTTGLGTVIEEVGAITLTADPFTNAAGGDFTLNTTAGGGALCRAASLAWARNADVGAVQAAMAAGGGGGGGNMRGGFING